MDDTKSPAVAFACAEENRESMDASSGGDLPSQFSTIEGRGFLVCDDSFGLAPYSDVCGFGICEKLEFSKRSSFCTQYSFGCGDNAVSRFVFRWWKVQISCRMGYRLLACARVHEEIGSKRT